MISELALVKMPAGKFVRFENGENQDGSRRPLVVWRWTCFHQACGEYGAWSEPRLSYFDAQTGEYCGDTI